MAEHRPMRIEAGSLSESLTQQFYDWERLGRGWQIYDFPVDPEPPFRPFFCHGVPEFVSVDDGIEQTSGLRSFFRTLIAAPRRAVEQLAPPPEREEIRP